ncbi:hypothetical protein [Pseudorhizobium flavum]|uniref:hypothetical protein n=1 Tax=Pseudorhizobium flavum TaxID=1335061 RepID=UPI0037707325
MEENYSPAVYQRCRLQLMTTIARLSLEGTSIESLEGRQRRRAQAKFDDTYKIQVGSIVGSNLELRAGLLGLYDDIYDAWERNGGLSVDASAWITQEKPGPTLEIPSLPQNCSKHLFVHMGKQESLELANIPGNSIEGVNVAASRTTDDRPAVVLAALCPRGGRPKRNDRIETLYLNQSSIVFTRYTDGKFEVIDGDPEMIGDPAVDLANRIALQQYVLTYIGFERFLEKVSSALKDSMGRADGSSGRA